jgi:hypothetical protein
MREHWKIINSLLLNNKNSNQIKHATEFKINTHTNTNESEIIAKEFNNYFTNIGSKLAEKIPNVARSYQEYLHEPIMDSLFLTPTSEDEVYTIVKNFNNKMCAGFDDVCLNIMKKTIKPILKTLVFIINQSLETGVVPDELKIALVTPIFKNGSKAELCNYRPISVLPSFSKIFEKIIFNRLTSFLDQKNVLISRQYGFRKGHSTNMALLKFHDLVTKSIESGKFTLGIFIDLEKAFDTIDHSILLTKLSFYGIRGKAHDWIKSYLNNRKQCVKYNTAISRLNNITHGVPQGSILGPLLFIIYVNDIQNVSNFMELLLFADDTNLLTADSDWDKLVENTNLELDKLSLWFKANKLSLNVKRPISCCLDGSI